MFPSHSLAPLLAGALLVPAVARGREDADPPPVVGVVVDAAGEPVPGAAVGTVPETGPTFTLTADADGRFRVPAERYPNGRADYPAVIARGPAGGPLEDHLGYAAYTDPESAGEAWAPELQADGTLRIALAPPRAVPVTVTGPDGPAAGVTVYALAGFAPVGVMTTGADGRAAFTLPAAARVSQIIALRRPDGDAGGLYADRRLGPDHDAGDGETERPDRLDLAAVPTFAHTVRVVAAAPGGGDPTPVAGATVRAWIPQRPGGSVNLPGLPFNDARTGPDGAAALDWLPRDLTRMDGWVRADGFESVRFSVEGAAAAPSQTVELVAGGALTGLVRNPDGTPAAGVPVRAVGAVPGPAMIENEHADAVTGPDGRYRFEVPGGAMFLVQVGTRGAGGTPGTRGFTSEILGMTERNAGGEIVSVPGETVELPDLLLIPGTPVGGTVRDHEGTPKVGVGMSLRARGAFPDRLLHPDSDEAAWMGDPYLSVRTETDAEGRYGFHAPPGEYSLFAAGAAIPANGWEVAVTDAPFEKDWTLNPPPKTRTYAGRVTDIGGAPVAGATVRIAGDSFELTPDRAAGSVVTGADGLFSLDLEGDRAAVAATAPAPGGGEPLVSGAETFFSAPTYAGNENPDRYDDLELVVRPTAVLTGAAVLELGVAGYAGVPVGLGNAGDLNDPRFDAAGPLMSEMTTGPRGRWVFLGARAGLTHTVWGPEGRGGSRWEVNRTAPAGKTGPTDVGAADVAGDELELPPVEDRRAAAFRPPADVPGLLAAYRAAAAALDRRVLVLVADPDSDAGADLFAAVYDELAPAAAADAGFLTLCLPPGPAAAAPGLRDVPADGAARLVVLDPAGGPPVAAHRHEPGERVALLAFLNTAAADD